jgi:hypothetical protein
MPSCSASQPQTRIMLSSIIHFEHLRLHALLLRIVATMCRSFSPFSRFWQSIRLKSSSSVPRKRHLPVPSGQLSIGAAMLESRPVQGPLSPRVFPLVLSVMLATFLQLSPLLFPVKKSHAATTAPLPCLNWQTSSLDPASPCYSLILHALGEKSHANHDTPPSPFKSPSTLRLQPPECCTATIRHPPLAPALAVAFVAFSKPRWPGVAATPC